MRRGYTRPVLEAQIRKYEEALKMNDEDFDDWLLRFGTIYSCPVCSYRDQFVLKHATACRMKDFEPCLAIVNGKRCDNQYWFKVVTGGGSLNFVVVRCNLTKRLKFWQRIFAEKYPVKS